MRACAYDICIVKRLLVDGRSVTASGSADFCSLRETRNEKAVKGEYPVVTFNDRSCESNLT